MDEKYGAPFNLCRKCATLMVVAAETDAGRECAETWCRNMALADKAYKEMETKRQRLA